MSAFIDGKVVVSYPLPPLINEGHSLLPSTVKEIAYMAFATHFDGKIVLTGIGLGKVNKKGKLLTSETANGVAKSMAKHPAFNGRLIVCECKNPKTANVRMITALKLAKNGDGLLVVCPNSNVYDDVRIFEVFGVERYLQH